MAFDATGLYLDRANFNSTTPQIGVGMHKYKSTTDTLATIAASGYFNDAYSPAPANNENEPVQLQTGDAILINGTDGTAVYQFTAVTPTATMTALSISPAIPTLLATNYTTVGGSATEVIALPGLGIGVVSTISVDLHTPGAAPVTVLSAFAGVDQVTVVFSADPSNDTVINLIVID